MQDRSRIRSQAKPHLLGMICLADRALGGVAKTLFTDWL